MGFSISWIALRGVEKAEALRRLGFRDVGSEDEANESPFSATYIPTGWTLIFSNDVDYGSAEHLRQISAGTTAVSCQVEEHVMFSAAHSSTDGHDDWSIWHDSQNGMQDLHTSGVLPVAFATTKARLLAEQDHDKDGQVDYVFDIPIDVAQAITGYRHDLWDFPWGPHPHWTVIEPRR